MNKGFLQVAMTNLSLLPPSGESPALLDAVAAVTGIAAPRLAYAEQRMAATGSLRPLRDLLMDPELRRTMKLGFTIGLKQVHRGKATPRESVVTHLTLRINTTRGRINIVVGMLVRRHQCFAHWQQQALLNVAYEIDLGGEVRTYRRRTSIAGATALPAVARAA